MKNKKIKKQHNTPTKKKKNKNKNKKIKILNKEFTKKKILFGVIGILILIIVILVNLGIEINFLTKDELHIGISPLQKVIETDYNKPANISFSIKNNNFWFCNTQCEFRLYDTSSGTIINTTNEVLKANSEIIKEYLINLNTIGHGQKIYYFEVECNNIKTLTCKTNEDKTYRSSMITINYNLPQQEELLRIELKKQLQNYTEIINNASMIINDIKLMTENINNITNTSLNLNNDEISLNSKNRNIQKFNNLWKVEKYIGISKIFTYLELNRAENFTNNLIEKKNVTKQNIQDYNNNVGILNNIILNISLIDNMHSFYLNIKDSVNITNTIELRDKVLGTLTMFKASTFEDVNELKNEINITKELFYSNINNWNENENNFEIESNNTINKHRKIIDSVYVIIGENKINIQNTSCEDILYLNNNYNLINTNANTLLTTTYQHMLSNKEFNTIKKAYKNSIINENPTVVFNIRDNTFIINNFLVVANTLNLTEKNYYSVITFNFSKEINNLSDKLCSNLLSNITEKLNKELFDNILFEYTNSEKNETNLFNDVPAKCCIFEECSECKIKKDNYPIVFIHGHSFNKDNPVESSLGTFSQIQRKMSEDKIAINSGDMNLESINRETIWSAMNYPLSVKASYYYITYFDLEVYSVSTRKTDSIEAYSLRLKDLIDEIKAKTGADKVNIVAHSMGGLVSRNYIKLFGEENVNKLILIGTPNKGVSGVIKTFCPSFGAKQECEDMSEDSIFLKKINDKKYIPNIDIYNFYGIGCKTDGDDGDGIVKANSVKLSYATNYEVKGQCTGTLSSNLHIDMINPEIHPEVYNKLIEILRE